MQKLLICLILLGCLCCVEGGKCTSLDVRYRYHRTGWWWGRRTVRTTYYITTYYCCPGYRGTNCDIPICRHSCKNGGTCVAPDFCNCPYTHTGELCDKALCSHLKPCFPGVCIYPDSCSCNEGFIGSKCLTMIRPQYPNITRSSSLLMFLKRLDNVEYYRFYADSGLPGVNWDNVVWLRMKDYNFINVYFEAQYEAKIPYKPQYVGSYKFGIIEGKARIFQTKVNRPGRDMTTITKDYPCPPIDRNNPIDNIYSCNITQDEFIYKIEDGDSLTLSAMARSGGYGQLVDHTQRYKYYGQQNYDGSDFTKLDMQFKFDFNKPYHCAANRSCKNNEKALTIVKDITKDPILATCHGWRDLLSGAVRATFYVFKLEPKADSVSRILTEITPKIPITLATRNINNGTCDSFEYRPPETGMYSILLEISDMANNTEYARRVFLYVPNSDITIFKNDPKRSLFVSSAAAETNYRWLANTQNYDFDGPPLEVSWNNHFENLILTKNNLLNSVDKFPRLRYDRYFRDIYINLTVDEYDDFDGDRTLAAIQHTNSIVKAEIGFEKDSTGGSNLGEEPSEGKVVWQNVPTFLLEKTAINVSRVSGETVRVWVKVHDVLGNVAVSHTDVHIDVTAPQIFDTENYFLERNIKNGSFPFSSRLIIQASDKQSGLFMTKWSLVTNDTNKTIKNGFVNANKSLENTISPLLGDCIPTQECFYYTQHIEINNCHFLVNKEQIDNQIIRIHLEVLNQAMLSSFTDIYVDNLKQLDGIDDYAGPMNVEISSIGYDSVTITWTQPPSCYNISKYQLVYNTSDGVTQTMFIHKDATQFTLNRLASETPYSFKFMTIYGEEQSDYIALSSTTAPEPLTGLPPGGTAGIAVVLIFLVGMLVVGVVLWRTGKLNVVKENIYGHIERRMTVIRERRAKSRAFQSNAYYRQSDIYMYGEMDMKKEVIVPSENITLVDKINESGRFADIYTAKNIEEPKYLIVAKVLKASHEELDKQVMKAKINFFSSVVGEHTNLLKFLGSVMDNEILGPYILLEYCSRGQLVEWLRLNKNAVNDSLIDTMFRISFGVAKGMEYLAKKEILHKHLAARNILLTDDMEPKIIGFGPNKYSENADENAKERLPMKWLPPECLKSLKDATTETDVWSFGVVLWEIFSLGDPPYENIRSRELGQKLKSGYRLSKPEIADDLHYNMMRRCWEYKPEQRPSFTDIREELGANFQSAPAADYYYSEN